MSGRKFLVITPLLLAVAGSFAFALLTSAAPPPGPALTFSFGGEDVVAPIEPALLRRRTITPEFNPPLGIRFGRVVYSRGPIACDPGEAFEVRVTITQGAATGQGRTAGRCTGGPQEWTVAVVASTSASFTPGPAHACGVATTRLNTVTDSFSWCADPVLIATS